MPFEPGATLDRYVIESFLGSGGMGEVYRARDARLHRSVALKVLRPEEDDAGTGGARRSTGGAARMLREARAAAALDHPNVIAIYDVGQIEADGELRGTTWIAMELIKGSSLRAYVGDPRVPLAQRVRWLADVARALGAAHAAGIVHRDVKPENVMIRDDGVVKVLDFGIARRAQGSVDPLSPTQGGALASVTAQGVVVGTPMYMAPEQLRAEPLDGRADQFAWGVVAYELLAGRLPWTTDAGGLALVAAILSSAPPSLAEAAPDAPAKLVAAVLRALEKSRDTRFASMEQLVDAVAVACPEIAAAFSLAPPPARSRATLDSGERSARGDTASFVSAPTEAVVTPPPLRGPRASGEAAAARPTTPSRAPLAAAFAIVLAGVAAAIAFGARGRGASPAPSASAAPPGCASSAACAAEHGGAPWICRASDHRCASLASDECAVLAAPRDVGADTTVWLGALYDLSNPQAVVETRGADLARRDFVETLGRVAGSRRVGLVSCDGRAHMAAAARHLADDVGVPAVLFGAQSVSDIVAIATSTFLPRDVLVLIPVSASPAVTALPDAPAGRLVWRTTYSTRALTEPLSAFVEQVHEPAIRRTGARRTRVAVVRDRSTAAQDFSALLLTKLRFNGESAVDNGDDFRELVHDGTAASYAAARAEIAAMRPTIIVGWPSADVERSLIAPLEEAWPAAVPRPTYLFPFGARPELLDMAAARASLRARCFWIDSVSSGPALAQLANHYNETFDDRVTRATAPSTSYDGFYALAYGIDALGGGPVTGPAIGRALARLRGPGKPFPVGSASIIEAHRELASGASIDLSGASSDLDFDPATGEVGTDFAILCARPGEGGAPARAIESGLTYDARSKRLVGTLGCR